MELMRGFSKKHGRRSNRLPWSCMQGKSRTVKGPNLYSIVSPEWFPAFTPYSMPSAILRTRSIVTSRILR